MDFPLVVFDACMIKCVPLVGTRMRFILTLSVVYTWQFLFSEQGDIADADRDTENSGYVHPHVDKLHCSLALLDVACVGLAKVLNLRYNQIGYVGAEKLAEALPTLRNLKVNWLGSPSLLYPRGIIVASG